MCCFTVLFIVHHILFKFESGWVNFMDNYPIYWYGGES